ncbi:MAG: hypothetical protein JKY10_09115 [Cohaesibacteraceae bacterium]|nr:hypothetical protein [Cohaesibacteraceae bacterium]
MTKLFKLLVVSIAVLLKPAMAEAACTFISLKKFTTERYSDPFSRGDFVPMIALEAGQFYPLAPDYKLEAPHDSLMLGRSYYIPQHLFGDKDSFSLSVMMLDLDGDTDDDLVLPPTTRHVPANTGEIVVGFAPFDDSGNRRTNRQKFTFEVIRKPGICDELSKAGHNMDRSMRQQNDLLALHTRILFYDKAVPIGGQDYQPYYKSRIQGKTRAKLLRHAFGIATTNARELLAFGETLKGFENAPGYDRIWSDYSKLIQRLALDKMELRYRDAAGNTLKIRKPSLVFHSGWNSDFPDAKRLTLPQAWNISLSR